MKIKPIHTEEDYKEALELLYPIFNADIGTEDGDRAEILSMLIERWEDEHYPIPKPDAVEVDFNYIYELVKGAESLEVSTLTEMGLKLNEEVGELSAEILKLVNHKNTNETYDEVMDNALGESVDSLIMVFDIMVRLGYTKDQIVERAERQINKWLTNINKNELRK